MPSNSNGRYTTPAYIYRVFVLSALFMVTVAVREGERRSIRAGQVDNAMMFQPLEPVQKSPVFEPLTEGEASSNPGRRSTCSSRSSPRTCHCCCTTS